MSKTVDEKVVEMKFNNQNFEKNISQSMNSIDKLKSKLDFKGTESKVNDSMSKIGSAANNIKLDGMTKAIDTVNYRFSTMGIVATNIINQITTSITGKLTGAVNSFIGQIKTGGLSRAMNLERASFQMTNLLNDEKEVEAVMQNVKDAVDGTAYGLDAAAVVASQLTASGAKAGTELYNQLRSIAGVAAMTSSSYEDIGNIYTTIAGQGKLMAMQLMQLATKGLNVAAIMSKQLNISEEEFRDKVHDGEITFQQFADAMVVAFGEAAGKANETFDGALSNVKSALSRIGEKFYTPGLTEARDVLNKLRVAINETNKSLDPFINSLNRMVHVLSVKVQNALQVFSDGFGDDFKNGQYIKVLDNITKGLESFSDVMVGEYQYIDRHEWNTLKEHSLWGDNYIDILKKVAKESNVNIDDLIEKYGSLENSLKTKWFTKDIFDKFIGEFSSNFTSSMDGIMTEIERNNRFADYLERLKKLYKSTYKDISDMTASDLKDKIGVVVTDEEMDQLKEFWSIAKENQMNVTQLAKQLNKEKLMSIGYSAEEAEKVQYLYKAYKEGTEGWSKGMSESLNNVNALNRSVLDSLGSITLNVGNVISSIFDSITIGADITTGYVNKKQYEHLKSLGIIKDGYIEILKTVAKEYDVDIDGMIKKYGSLENSLKTKWFTKEMFDDVSKAWISSLDPIMADIEHIEQVGKKLQSLKEYYQSETKILQVLNSQNGVDTDTGIVLNDEERREMLHFWELAKESNTTVLDLSKQLGKQKLANIGYSQSEASVVIATYKAYKYGVSPLNEVSNIIEDTNDKFISFSMWIKSVVFYIEEMTKAISDWFNADERIEKLAKTFSGFFAIIRIGFNILDGIGIVLKSVLHAFGILGDTALDLSSSIGEALVKLSEFIEESQIFQRIGKALAAVINLISSAFKTLYDFIKKLFGFDGNVFVSLANAIKSLFEAIFGNSDVVVTTLEKLTNKISEFSTKMEGKTGVLQKVAQALKNIVNNIIELLNKATVSIFKADFMAILTGGIIVIYNRLRSIKYLATGIYSMAKEAFKQFNNLNRIKDILGDLDSALYQLSVNIKSDSLWKIAKSIALLAGSLALLASIDQDGLGKALATLTALAGIMGAFLTAITFVSEKFALLTDKLNPKKGGLFGGIGKLLGDSQQAMNESIRLSTIGNMLLKIAGSILMISMAYKIITDAIKNMDGSDFDHSWEIFITMIVSLIGGVAILNYLPAVDDKKLKHLGNMLLKMSVSMVIISLAFSIISKAVSNAKSNESLEWSIGVFAIAIMALVVGILAIITVTSSVDTIKLAGVAGVMLAMSASILIMSWALKNIEEVVSNNKWYDTLASVIVMAAMMGIAIGAVIALSTLMSSGIGAAALVGAAAVIAVLSASMLGFSFAISILLGAIVALENAFNDKNNHMWQALGYLAVLLVELALGMTMLTFGIVGANTLIILANALKVLVPIMLMLAAIPTDTIFEGFKKIIEIMLGFALVGSIVTLLSPMLLIFGSVLMVVGAGLAFVAISLAAFVAAFTLGASFVQLSSEVIVAGANRVADSVIAFLNKIIDNADIIIGKLYDSILKNKDKIISVVSQMIEIATTAILKNLPKLLFFIDVAVTTIAEHFHVSGIVHFIGSLVRVFDTFFGYIAGILDTVTQNGENTGQAYIDGIKNMIGRLTDAAIELIVAFENSLADSIRNHREDLRNAGRNIVDAVIEVMGNDEAQNKSDTEGQNVVTGFIRGLSKYHSITFGGGTIASVGSMIGQLAINAIHSGAGNGSPSKKTFQEGIWVIQGMINGLKQNKELISVSESVGELVVDKMKTALDVLQDYASREYSIEPTIAPVLDMNGMTATAEEISQLLSGDTTFGIAASVNAKLNQIQNEDPYYDITRAINTLHNDLQELDANNYTINGVTYDDGSNVANAVGELISAVKVGRRA